MTQDTVHSLSSSNGVHRNHLPPFILHTSFTPKARRERRESLYNGWHGPLAATPPAPPPCSIYRVESCAPWRRVCWPGWSVQSPTAGWEFCGLSRRPPERRSLPRCRPHPPNASLWNVCDGARGGGPGCGYGQACERGQQSLGGGLEGRTFRRKEMVESRHPLWWAPLRSLRPTRNWCSQATLWKRSDRLMRTGLDCSIHKLISSTSSQQWVHAHYHLIVPHTLTNLLSSFSYRCTPPLFSHTPFHLPSPSLFVPLSVCLALPLPIFFFFFWSFGYFLYSSLLLFFFVSNWFKGC